MFRVAALLASALSIGAWLCNGSVDGPASDAGPRLGPPSAWELAAPASRAIAVAASAPAAVQPAPAAPVQPGWSGVPVSNLVERAVTSRRASDLLAARHALEICSTALLAASSRQDKGDPELRHHLSVLALQCGDDARLTAGRQLLQKTIEQLQLDSDDAILARAGLSRSVPEQARAMRIALGSGDPALISQVAGEALGSDVYRQLDASLEVGGHNTYDREMLTIAWQVWACKQANNCEAAMTGFAPCIKQGYCSQRLSDWPQQHLFSADSSYGYAVDMNARGFSAALREQRWKQLYGLVERIAGGH